MADIKYCTTCGNQLNIKAEICPKCGVRQIGRDSNRKIVAGVLALLLGGFGIHHFYLGRTLRGLVYLLLCWTFIPAILSFIEAIIILTMSDEKFEAKYS